MVVRTDEAHHHDVKHFASDIHYQGHELKEAPAPIGSLNELKNSSWRRLRECGKNGSPNPFADSFLLFRIPCWDVFVQETRESNGIEMFTLLVNVIKDYEVILASIFCLNADLRALEKEQPWRILMLCSWDLTDFETAKSSKSSALFRFCSTKILVPTTLLKFAELP
ncbi:unnamed protein product [Fraxinus pennsylvanica]|uniref:Uncharacterized protein n=1 Tax=Fraxinus pennsylvanica TaxID=56036 RepID=A0AAD2EEC6_9LAMI|nr:unnamed protein product [Fraxinus pennsylvanica]